jgi:hypothetical protein
MDENHRKRIHKGGKVEFYQPILDQYEELLKQHPVLDLFVSEELVRLGHETGLRIHPCHVGLS